MKKSLIAVIVIALLGALITLGGSLSFIFTADRSHESEFTVMVLATVVNALPMVLCYIFAAAGAVFALKKNMLAFLYTFLCAAICGYRLTQILRFIGDFKRAAAGTVESGTALNQAIIAQWVPFACMAAITVIFTALSAVRLKRCRNEEKDNGEVKE